ncbi:hypothetical protein [Phytohabitans suffuscus]|uniref:Uncharacterized protein n=1 Tax=Phytohabitans suffuscus TaxID=624315 RepID=A0A6F8YNW0_9ACTN|nr:hypothetical protein [Phytohabitans suffuscus]BCB87568.1 hypothetical protein Psuf_048810 [Phytohabitans suffuscus]
MNLLELAPEGPPPGEVWRYKWAVTLTMREEDPAQVREKHLVVDSVDELVELVLHSSLDPRIAAYAYHRFATLDMTAAPEHCTQCGEPYPPLTPGRAWRTTQPCTCGGHAIFSCGACGTRLMYPRVESTCVTDPGGLLAMAPRSPRPGDRRRRQTRPLRLWKWWRASA